MCLLATCFSISESSAFCHCAAQSSGDGSPSIASACSRWLGKELSHLALGILAVCQGARVGREMSSNPAKVIVFCALPRAQLSRLWQLFCLNTAEGLFQCQSLTHSQADSRNHCILSDELRYYQYCKGGREVQEETERRRRKRELVSKGVCYFFNLTGHQTNAPISKATFLCAPLTEIQS